MDWSRTGSYLELFAWAALTLLTWGGGWLLCAHVFKLRSRERLAAGLALGLLLFTLAANLIAQVAPPTVGFWAAAILTAGGGLAAAWRAPARSRFPLEDLRHWPALAALAGLFLVFLNINRGLALFDDYAHLPIVSIVASGDIPPHFYLNPEIVADYHYGSHLLAAALVRVGGFYPWTALDVYKALAIALAAVLGTLWFRRFTRPGLAVLLAAGAVLFAGGSRWLLLFLPGGFVRSISAGVEMLGSAMQSAPSLPEALIKAWNIEGGGPLPFPFAFANGISTPLTFAMGSGGALPLMALYLLLMLSRRRWTPAPGLVFGLALSSLALISEQWFGLVWGGIAAAAGLRAIQKRSLRPALDWAWPLLPGAILAPVMGGVLTALLRRMLAAPGAAAGGAGLWLPNVALRWPPALLSSHLGELQLARPGHLIVALAEIGPLLLLGIPVTLAIPKTLRSGKLTSAGLAIMALISLALPILIRFTERDRDITRLTSGALSIWMALGLPYLWAFLKDRRRLVAAAAGAAYAAAVFGGLALLPIQLIAGFQPQASYFIQEPDVWMSRQYWNNLEPGAWVLDPAVPYRPAALFARTTGPAYASVYIENRDFLALLGRPSAADVRQAGYRYVYVDRKTWSSWTPEIRRSYQGCARLVAERKTAEGDFRRLYDVQSCAELESFHP